MSEHKRIWLSPTCDAQCERTWCEDPQGCDECEKDATEYVLASERDTALADAARMRSALEATRTELFWCAGQSPSLGRIIREQSKIDAVLLNAEEVLSSTTSGQDLLDKMRRMEALFSNDKLKFMIGKSICAEQCSERGEMPCYDVRDSVTGKHFAWPPESCDSPGCIWLARRAVDDLRRAAEAIGP